MKGKITEMIVSIIVMYLIGSCMFLSLNPYEWSITGISILTFILGKVLGDLYYGRKE
jgi:hypothetical protein